MPARVVSNGLTYSDKKPVCAAKGRVTVTGFRLGQGTLQFFLSPTLCACVCMFV